MRITAFLVSVAAFSTGAISFCRAEPVSSESAQIIQTITDIDQYSYNNPPVFIDASTFDNSIGTLTDVTLQLSGFATGGGAFGIFTAASPAAILTVTGFLNIFFGGTSQTADLGPTIISIPPGVYTGGASANVGINTTFDLSHDLAWFESSNPLLDPGPEVQPLINYTFDATLDFSNLTFFEPGDPIATTSIEDAILTYSYIPVPEPNGTFLLLSGLLGLVQLRRRAQPLNRFRNLPIQMSASRTVSLPARSPGLADAGQS